MPQVHSQYPDPSIDPPSPKAPAPSETLFLLSVCRDEDDAAALRSDLKRSGMGDYKIQRCAHLDDALQLLQVCGFDLAFVRLDDFQDPQAAIDLIRQNDPELALVALGSQRLLKTQGFQMPIGIDGHCRLEDLSPTLVSSLVASILEQRRDRQERQRLNQELHFALEVGELGSWTLDTDTGRITLSEQALEALEVDDPDAVPFLDDFLESVYPADQDRLKRLFEDSIENQGDLEANVRLARDHGPGPTLHLSALFRPGCPRTHATLTGLIKREAEPSAELQSRVAAANHAIREALSRRDTAIATACQELDSLLQQVNPAAPTTTAAPKEEQRSPAAPQAPAAAQPQPAVSPTTPAAAAPAPNAPQDQLLGIDKAHALQQVLKSISQHKAGPAESAFPFDFSTETASNYAEPNPQSDGFIEAAKRLVDITQSGHDLSVTLSVDNDGAIESERERELLFEILRELLTNVVKHARASECIVALFRDEDDWVLQVEDDGVGLENNLVSISTPLNKIGLFRIRTKLALKGGQLDLTPTFPKGLIARARLPVCLVSRGAERA